MITAKKHDIAYLVSYSLEKANLLDMQSEFGQKCEKEQFVAAYRYENNNYELEQISRLFEEEKIFFVPLKGAVLKRYYPEEWMRIGTDLDVLVREDICEKAKDILVEKLNYKFESKENHDYQLVSPGGVSVELHFTLLGTDSINKEADKILENVWEYTVPAKDCKYHMEFTDDMFYYYHFIHLAKHIKYGGCGIKPFLDLYILKKSVEYGPEKQALIDKGNLTKLDKVVCRLADCYFLGEEYDEQTLRLSAYVTSGKNQGRFENRMAFQAEGKKSKAGLLVSKVFSPYEILKFRYPELEQKKWLFIPYQFRRWYDLFFGAKSEKTLNELKANKSINSDKIDEVSKMRQDLGL